MATTWLAFRRAFGLRRCGLTLMVLAALTAHAHAQAINGTFDGSAGWTNVIPADGAISYAGNNLRVTGVNNGATNNLTVMGRQTLTTDSTLEFDLVSYTSTDSGSFDYPVFFLDGQMFGLNADGTLGAATAGGTGGAGTIRNSNQVANVHFTVAVSPGTHTIGFGVLSTDTCCGPGIAIYDNIITNVAASTHQTVRRFLQRRNDMLLSNGPNLNRQLDRLANGDGGGSSGTGGPGFVQNAQATSGLQNAFRVSTLASAGSATDGRRIQSVRSSLGGPVQSTRAMSAFAGSGLFDDDPQSRVGSPSALPFGFTVSDEHGDRKSFSTSLVQIAKAAADAKRRKLGGGGAQLQKLGIDGTMLASPRDFGLDVWVEGQIVHFEEGADGSAREGDFGVLYVGADYVLSPSILVGALVQFDKMDDVSRDLSTSVNGHGWMIGPYATVKLTDQVFAQGRAAWGKSDNNISPVLTYTDRFDTERWLIEGTLQGRWNVGRFMVSPHATVGYIEEDQKSYTDSLGIFIPSQTVSLGQARFGPRVSYSFLAPDGTTLEPFAEFEGIWNFEESSTSIVATTLASREELRGKIELGFKAIAASGVSLSVSGSYDGIGADDLDAVAGQAIIRFPFN